MNVLQAAKDTMSQWSKNIGTSNLYFTELLERNQPELSNKHCEEMLTQMTTQEFSYGKQCRWLGWIQASCVINGCGTLEEMKEINRRNK